MAAAAAAVAVLALTPRALAYRTVADEEGLASVTWAAPAYIQISEDVPDSFRPILQRELQAAIDTWNGVECAEPMFALSVDETSDAVISLRELAGEAASPDVDAAATTELVFQSRASYAEIVEARVFLNSAIAFGAHPQSDDAETRDLRAVLVHELGHVLGLAHPCELTAEGCRDEHADVTMHPLYAGASQAVLSDDDRRGVCDLYPARVTEPPPEPQACESDGACEEGEWCLEGSCQTEFRFGRECEAARDCPAMRCLEQAEGGVCTLPCLDSRDCPAQTACVSVVDSEDRVCAPSAGGGCSASSSSARSRAALPVWALALFLTWWLLRRPRARRRLGAAAPLLLALAVGAAGCGDGDADGVDAGGSRDAASMPDSGGTDAGPESCGEDGAMRVADCGMCGTESQECSGGIWQAVSACLGQGECAAAAVETESLDFCGERQRLCSATCEWGAWEDVRPSGECEPGSSRLVNDMCPDGEFAQEVCDATTCEWAMSAACSNPCGGTPRTMPEDAAEVCVPAGPFVRGSTNYPDAQPVAEVTLSAYYIDRYPVTNRRFRACRVAGGCRSLSGFGLRLHSDFSRDNYPVQGFTRDRATEFCMWDGGRRLPTEAEWEKAVRGPAPRTNPYPWEGTEFRCDLLPAEWCEGIFVSDRAAASDPIDGLPGTRSFYGTFLQMGGVWEVVSDLYDPAYYADPSSLVDPSGPAAGVEVWRGYMRGELQDDVLSRRQPRDRAGVATLDNIGFRCARSAP